MRHPAFYLVLAGLFIAAPAMAQQKSAPVTCPDSLHSYVAMEGADARFWKLGGPRQELPLKGARVYYGKAGEEAMKPENQIKPLPNLDKTKGQLILSWGFSDQQRGNLLLVCDYAGAENFLMRVLDPVVASCNEYDPIDKANPVVKVMCQ